MSTSVTTPLNAWTVVTMRNSEGATSVAIVSVATTLCTWLCSAKSEKRAQRLIARANRKCKRLNAAHERQISGARIDDQDYWSGY